MRTTQCSIAIVLLEGGRYTPEFAEMAAACKFIEKVQEDIEKEKSDTIPVLRKIVRECLSAEKADKIVKELYDVMNSELPEPNDNESWLGHLLGGI